MFPFIIYTCVFPPALPEDFLSTCCIMMSFLVFIHRRRSLLRNTTQRCQITLPGVWSPRIIKTKHLFSEKGPRTELALEHFCVSSFNLSPNPIPDSGHFTCYRDFLFGGVGRQRKEWLFGREVVALKMGQEVGLNAKIFFHNGRRMRSSNGDKI